jgi:hypothetical protein
VCFVYRTSKEHTHAGQEASCKSVTTSGRRRLFITEHSYDTMYRCILDCVVGYPDEDRGQSEGVERSKDVADQSNQKYYREHNMEVVERFKASTKESFRR